MRRLPDRVLVAVIVVFTAAAGFAAEPEKPKPPRYSDIPQLLKQMEKSNEVACSASKRLELAPDMAFDGLMDLLGSKKPFARWWAASLLAKTKNARALKPIALLCSADPDAMVRSVAVWSLSTYTDESAWEAIVKALQDKDQSVRGWAMKAITEHQYKKALPEVRKLLKHGNKWTRLDAVVTVFFVIESGRLEFLREILRKEKDVDNLVGALSCLTRLPEMTPDVMGVFITQLSSPYEKVRKFANTLLVKGADEDFGFVADGPGLERINAVQKWRNWYDENKKRLKWDPIKRKFYIPGSENKGRKNPVKGAEPAKNK